MLQIMLNDVNKSRQVSKINVTGEPFFNSFLDEEITIGNKYQIIAQ